MCKNNYAECKKVNILVQYTTHLFTTLQSPNDRLVVAKQFQEYLEIISRLLLKTNCESFTKFAKMSCEYLVTHTRTFHGSITTVLININETLCATISRLSQYYPETTNNYCGGGGGGGGRPCGIQ